MASSEKSVSIFGAQSAPQGGRARLRLSIAPLIALLAAVGLTAQADGISAPEITSQGFDIANAVEMPLGTSHRIRVRFEVPERIEELYIRERSFEVDLATTPDRANLPLFGVDRQVRQLTDVTLDFQRYIDAKLDVGGDYEFELRVTDRKGTSATAMLLIRIVSDAEIEEPAASLGQSAFRFAREGAGDVRGADDLGIAWRTIESNQVVIELAMPDAGAARFFETMASDYDNTRSKAQLAQLASSAPELGRLQLAAARNQATGSVFGMSNGDMNFIVKVTGSTTALSDLGTTVTLEGEYKY